MSREERREEFSSVSSSRVFGFGFGLVDVVGEVEEDDELDWDATKKERCQRAEDA